jgi:CubicO group peptidase (beta-lactamase class C family)
MSVSAEDQALVGQMMLDNGMARGKRVLSEDWIKRMQVPCALAPFYGYLVWLNGDQKVFPSVPASSYFAVGAGSSFTWVEPELNMVVIIRWLNSAHADAVFGKIYQAVKALA